MTFTQFVDSLKIAKIQQISTETIPYFVGFTGTQKINLVQTVDIILSVGDVCLSFLAQMQVADIYVPDLNILNDQIKTNLLFKAYAHKIQFNALIENDYGNPTIMLGKIIDDYCDFDQSPDISDLHKYVQADIVLSNTNTMLVQELDLVMNDEVFSQKLIENHFQDSDITEVIEVYNNFFSQENPDYFDILDRYVGSYNEVGEFTTDMIEKNFHHKIEYQQFKKANPKASLLDFYGEYLQDYSGRDGYWFYLGH